MKGDRLRVLRKEAPVKKEIKLFSRFVLVGHDVFTLNMFQFLNNKFPGQVKIVNDRYFENSDLEFHGPSMIRGEVNIAWLKQNVVALADRETHGSVFYKDQKFHRFGSRTKPEALILQEPYYQEQALNIQTQDLLPDIHQPEFLNTVNANTITSPLLRLRITTPSDLIERAHFEMDMADASTLRCEYLFWSDSYKRFIDLFEHKEQLKNEFIEWSEHIAGPMQLKIQLDFSKIISEEKGTLFIPQSQTHDWGHYIGEFTTHLDGKQCAQFLVFVDAEHTDEETISKILRNFKRSLEKIFPDCEKYLTQEFISLRDKAPCLKIDDQSASLWHEMLPNLYFIGQDAPLTNLDGVQPSFEYSKKDTTHAVRAMLVQSQIEQSLLGLN